MEPPDGEIAQADEQEQHHALRDRERRLAARGRQGFDELSGRHKAKFGPRIDLEQASLQALPGRRTVDFEETLVTVTSSSGFVLRKVFYTMPSRLIGHRLRARLYDDRLDLFLGSTLQTTTPRGRAKANGAGSRRRLPPHHPFAPAQTHGADGPGLS